MVSFKPWPSSSQSTLEGVASGWLFGPRCPEPAPARPAPASPPCSPPPHALARSPLSEELRPLATPSVREALSGAAGAAVSTQRLGLLRPSGSRLLLALCPPAAAPPEARRLTSRPLGRAGAHPGPRWRLGTGPRFRAPGAPSP